MQPHARVRFQALGTEILVIGIRLDPDALRARVEGYEARFSRFRPDSELNLLSMLAGRKASVSREMFDVLSLAAELATQSGGLFDPLIRTELEAAGYDRTFSAVPRTSPAPPPPACPAPGPRYSDVVLDREQRAVLLPAGARLDLGGIAKGWIVDRLSDELATSGPFLIDAGGDMSARGDGPGGRGWLVAVADPFAPSQDIAWLRLRDQSIATSTTLRRRWRRDGEWQHHLIDPRTGLPSTSDVVQATVVAPNAATADVYAKTALLLGARQGKGWLTDRDLPGLLVTKDGPITTPRWPDIDIQMAS